MGSLELLWLRGTRLADATLHESVVSRTGVDARNSGLHGGGPDAAADPEVVQGLRSGDRADAASPHHLYRGLALHPLLRLLLQVCPDPPLLRGVQHLPHD